MRSLTAKSNTPHTDHRITESREESGPIRRPREGDACWLSSLLPNRAGVFITKLVDNGLGLEIPNLDTRVGRSAQPVAVRGEAKRMDDIVGLKGVQMLALLQIPKHGNTIFATGGAQRTVWRHGHGVEVTGVVLQVRAELAVCKVPDLDQLIPALRTLKLRTMLAP